MISSSEPTTLSRAQPWLGTLVSIEVSGLGAQDALHALDAAFEEVKTVHRLMSFHDPLSEVSRINALRCATPLALHPYTFTVLQRAEDFSALSQGCFDVTVGSDLVRWGSLPSPPGGQTREKASWKDLELLSDTCVRVHRPVCIDLGGIAKGFAVDRATSILQAWGAERSVVNAGGDIRVRGTGAEWIALAAEAGPEGAPVLALEDGSVASSGAHQGSTAQKAMAPAPHVDGRSRTPVHPQRFVSVLASDCLVADALTKVVMAQGTECEALLQTCGAQAYFHDPGIGWQSLCLQEQPVHLP